MKTTVLFLGILLTASGALAQMTTFDQRFGYFVSTIGPVSIVTQNGVSWSRFSFIGLDSKIILDSQDDAAYFVATKGEVCGSHLVQAFKVIRNRIPDLKSSDLELATQILQVTVQ